MRTQDDSEGSKAMDVEGRAIAATNRPDCLLGTKANAHVGGVGAIRLAAEIRPLGRAGGRRIAAGLLS